MTKTEKVVVALMDYGPYYNEVSVSQWAKSLDVCETTFKKARRHYEELVDRDDGRRTNLESRINK